jgi:hypothetical protein
MCAVDWGGMDDCEDGKRANRNNMKELHNISKTKSRQRKTRRAPVFPGGSSKDAPVEKG